MLVQSLAKQTENCYIVQTVFAWEESIDPARFEAAWRELANRHEVLRSRFRWKDTLVPLQIVVAAPAIDGGLDVSSSADGWQVAYSVAERIAGHL
jgi:hypothetical protein